MATEVPNNVRQLKLSNQGLLRSSHLESGGGPPHDPHMEKRLAQLEALVPTLATKADVEKASHDVTKWVIGTMVGGVGLFIVIMTFVLNNAIPRVQPAASSPAPIIIQAPVSPPAAQLAPQHQSP